MPAQHPWLQRPVTSLFNGSTGFPPQLLPLAKKNEEWKKANLDTLEAIGRVQYYDNQRFLENYRMLNGEFLRHHYEDVPENEFRDLLEMIPEEMRSPVRLRHFDFSIQVVNAILGELEGHPDTFRAVAKGDVVSSQREEEKARLLLEYVKEQITTRIDQELKAQGLDPDQQQPDEQQQAAYDQQVDAARQAMTPQQIQKYMATKWQHIAEKWANIQLSINKERYRHAVIDTVEMKDKILTGRCFRHFYLTATGYMEETWNNLECFYDKNITDSRVEKGGYAGRTYYLSLADIIDRFGHKMNGRQIEELEGYYQYLNQGVVPRDYWGNKINYLSPDGLPYAQRLPTNNAFLYNSVPHVKDTTAGLNMDLLFQSKITSPRQHWYVSNLFQITEAYWKSQKKVGKLTWYNPLTDVVEKMIVDESVELPEGIREIEGNLYGNPDEDEPGTIEWTWINEIWGGIKITPLAGFGRMTEPLYLEIAPVDFQGKPDSFIYDPELPVVGDVDLDRSGESQAFFDILKPYQIAFNLFLNQLYQMAEGEVMPFLLMDTNIIPNQKDWGGEDGFIKWMEAARQFHVGPLDTRPHVTQGANSGGQYPQIINMTRTEQMMGRFNLAMNVMQLGLSQVGFNPQRLADIKAQETATGINAAMEKSYTQTATVFSRFYNYKQRCLQKGLDFSQFVQSRQKDITIAATQSDFTQTFLKLVGTDLLGPQLHVYLSNSQETQRQLQMIRQLGLDNSVAARTSDRMGMVTTNSIEQIRELVLQSEQRQDQMAEREMAVKEQQVAQAADQQAAERQWKSEENRLDRISEEKQEYIRTFGGRNNANTTDTDDSGLADVLEYDKLSQKADTDSRKLDLGHQQLEQDRLKLIADQDARRADRDLEREKLRSNEQIQRDKIQQARILGDKSR